ncbi:mediator of replication checkpoint protein 1 [Sporothrix schenckii 1099-18]|uniref:Mediator of replication checkpoint protein 1 n=1 Tax=Sporothrix schenckii 1099-18 TaxID=1397361 RepID=A0A0F2LY89_SPOSC|nr:mediator of replication checkpoint protein 1 [Sporothrix schenckii 1099-18]KJR81819.1 mediator of replication checkpoint protein 1 [Sporothrix schenckii 1099-18]
MDAPSRTPSPAAGSGSDSDSVVATPMTPRTKLRELFATIDGGNAGSSGSDHERESNEENKTPSRKARKTSAQLSARKSPRFADASTFARVRAASTPTTSPQKTRQSSRSPRAMSPLVRAGALAASSDEDSDMEVRPRGRFAARMQAAVATDSTTATAEPPADNARERVKRMLQQAADAGKQQGEDETAAKSHEDTTNDAEDEEDLPVAARPRKRLTNLRTARRSASASSRQSVSPSRSKREDSPPMFMTPSKQADREDSPDMFVTPEKGGDDVSGAADSAAPGRNARFQALVARKRKEARALEEAEERKLAARMAAMADNSDNDDDDEAMDGLDEDDDILMRDAEGADDNPSDITDDEGGRRLTQKMAGARPERKASKKAIEEMHRETQRMARNLQLAHEAKTRKRVTKASLFERFNYHPTGVAAASAAPAAKEPTSSSRPTSPTSPHNNTDSEMRAGADTPPSSPPVPVVPGVAFDKAKEAAVTTATTTASAESADAALAVPKLDKGKGKAVEAFIGDEQPKPELKRNIRVRMPAVQTNLVMIDSDDDGELEIVQTAKNKLDILFDNVPLKRNREPRSMYALRRLAQIGSPGKKPRARPSAHSAKNASGAGDLTLSELQQSLQDRARLQAKLEREERLDMLRAKGVRIQTDEERERELEEVDDIVARARQEAEELMQRERDEAKKEKRGDGADAVPDVLDWDESEDEDDYDPDAEEEEEEVEEREIELSGSEDEDEEKEGDEEVLAGTLIDGEAESTDNDSEDGKDDAEEKEDDEVDAANAAGVLPTPTRPRPRSTKRRAALIVSDDEDTADDHNNTPAAAKSVLLPFEAKTPGPKTAFVKSPSGLASNNDSPQVPTSVLRSATKTFIPGLPVAVGGPAGLGLTQIFAGTMSDNSQMPGSPGGVGSPPQFMPTLGNLVDANFSQAAASGEKANETNAADVLDSQQTQEWIKRMQGGSSNNAAGSNANDANNDNNGNNSNESNGATGPSQMVQFNFSQSQVHGLDSLLREPDVSQMSLLGPSQDNGPQEYTPLKVRFIEHQPSTMETVVLGEATQQTQPLTQSQAESQPVVPSPSPVVQRRPRGRLFRKTDVVKIVEEDEEEEEEQEQAADAADEDDEEEEAVPTDNQSMEAATAFAKMRQAALQKQFDRKKSKAKEMVEEQAEESEDEYAGLGGADGEDSDNESMASVKDIIDDDQKVSSTDNAKLAAFYADRERENDEKQVEKLFRDVTTGMLRRKRGAGGAGDYDLSDSDDGGEARRRMKRRQFARMQQALFADERVSKVAENPRNQAFLRTIEDRGSDDEMDFIFDGAAEHPAAASTSTSTTATASTASPAVPGVDTTTSIPDSQPSGPPAPTAATVQKQQQNHPRRRRLSANPGKKPANLGEIRESLSSLLEDYHNDGSNLSIVADSEFGSDGEEQEDDGNKENEPLAAAVATGASAVVRRRPGRSHNVQVVDRISLKRNNSNMSSASASSAASTSSSSASSTTMGGGGVSLGLGPTGFRVPALLRRATTNSLVSNGSASSSSSSNNSTSSDKNNSYNSAGKLGDKDDGKIKKNASKMSGIHYFARENERRAAIAASDKRRQAKKAKNAEGRARAVGGLFGAGKFE